MSSILEAFEKGRAEAKDWRKKLKDTKTLSNVFADTYVTDNPEAFVFSAGAKEIAELIGQASETPKEKPHITISGPHRSGKSTIVKRIAQELRKQKRKPIKTKYISYNQNF